MNRRSLGRSPLLAACLVLVIIGLAAAALAYTWRRPAGKTQEGHRLAGYGRQGSNVIGFRQVHQGSTYRFAFPVPRNKSDQAVKLTGASVHTTPTGTQVIGYSIYSLEEVGGYLLSYDDSAPEGPMSLRGKKDYAPEGISIPPRSDSKFFVMIVVKVVGPVTQVLSGCTFDYVVGSHKYHQTLPCEFQLGDNP